MNSFIAVAHHKIKIDNDLLTVINDKVNSQLPGNTSFKIVNSNGVLSNIDFSWFKTGGPRISSNVLILCFEKNSQLIATTMSGLSFSNLNLRLASILLNWIGYVDVSKYNYPAPDFSQDILFDVDDIDLPGEGDKYVYHYTSWKNVKNYILSGEKQFLVNIAKKMNDPLEQNSYDLINKIERTGNNISTEQLIRLSKALKKSSKENIRIFSTTLDQKADVRPFIESNGNSTIAIIKKRRRGFDHPKMWSHYGDNHKGVCLILNKDAINKKIVDSANPLVVRSYKVNYVQTIFDTLKGIKIQPPESPSENSNIEIEEWATEEIQKLIPNLFFTKHDDWNSEVEYRWVIGGQYNGDFLFPMESKDLAGMIVGSDFPMDLFESANQIAKDNEIPIRIMMWNLGQAGPPWPLPSEETPDDILNYFKNRDTEAQSRN